MRSTAHTDGAATAAFGFATWDRSGDAVATKVISAASLRVMVGGPAPETLLAHEDEAAETVAHQ